MDPPQIPTITVVLVGKEGTGKRTIFEAYNQCTVDPTSPALAVNRVKQKDPLDDDQGNAQISESCILRTRQIGQSMVGVMLHWLHLDKDGAPMQVTDLTVVSNARAIVYVFDLSADPTFAGAGDLARAVSNMRRVRNSGPYSSFIVGAKNDLVRNASVTIESAASFLASSPRFSVSAKNDPRLATAIIDQIVTNVKAQIDNNGLVRQPALTHKPAYGPTPVPGTAVYGTAGQQSKEYDEQRLAARTLSSTDGALCAGTLPVLVVGGPIDWEQSRPCVVPCSIL